MTDRPLRIALFSFAHVHAETYARMLSARADVELVVTDPDGLSGAEGLRGRELAEQLGVRYVATYEEALEWGPHAVVVTSETNRHRELSERAIAAGAHVLCEKPLATTLADAQAFVEKAERAGVLLMTAYPVRFAPEYAELRACVHRGEIGTVLSIRGTNNGKIPAGRSWFTDPVAAGGGALVDHVVHCADLIDDLLQETPESIRAVGNSIIGDGAPVETGGLVTMTFPSGAIATIDCTWNLPDSAPTWGDLTLQVVGTGGVVSIAPFGAGVSGVGRIGTTWQPVGADLDELMITEFLSAIREGRSPRTDAGSGMRTLRIVEAALLSARTGETVLVRDEGTPPRS